MGRDLATQCHVGFLSHTVGKKNTQELSFHQSRDDRRLEHDCQVQHREGTAFLSTVQNHSLVFFFLSSPCNMKQSALLSTVVVLTVVLHKTVVDAFPMRSTENPRVKPQGRRP